MKNNLFKTKLIVSAVCLALASCSDSDNPDNPTPTPDVAEGKYVVLTAESGSGASGYYAAYSEMPSGDVDNVGGYSLQARTYGGFRHYKNWIFNRAKHDGEVGVVRYSLTSEGKLANSGFVKCGTSAQNLVVDETTGFYFDADLGKTKVQKFNPSTMQRTGEIDLSSLVEKGADISTNVYTGNQTLVAKEGKLYANITYSRVDGSGHNDNTRNYTLAVIDIATGKPEKTITHKFAKNHGHSPSEYAAYAQAEDGTLYFVTTGWDYGTDGLMVSQPSAIFRIKAGSTDFDEGWVLKATDLGLPEYAQLWSVKALNGKLYVDASDVAIERPSLSNLTSSPYHVYSVDTESKKATKIANMPATVFGHSTGNLEIVDNSIYVRVVNTETGDNGYYKVDAGANTASKAFQVTRGGTAKGFVRLADK